MQRREFIRGAWRSGGVASRFIGPMSPSISCSPPLRKPQLAKEFLHRRVIQRWYALEELERILSVGDVQNFAWHTGLKLFVTPLAHVYERISGAAQVHLVLGIDSALYSDSGVPQV